MPICVGVARVQAGAKILRLPPSREKTPLPNCRELVTDSWSQGWASQTPALLWLSPSPTSLDLWASMMSSGSLSHALSPSPLLFLTSGPVPGSSLELAHIFPKRKKKVGLPLLGCEAGVPVGFPMPITGPTILQSLVALSPAHHPAALVSLGTPAMSGCADKWKPEMSREVLVVKHCPRSWGSCSCSRPH